MVGNFVTLKKSINRVLREELSRWLTRLIDLLKGYLLVSSSAVISYLLNRKTGGPTRIMQIILFVSKYVNISEETPS